MTPTLTLPLTLAFKILSRFTALRSLAAAAALSLRALAAALRAKAFSALTFSAAILCLDSQEVESENELEIRKQRGIRGAHASRVVCGAVVYGEIPKRTLRFRVRSFGTECRRCRFGPFGTRQLDNPYPTL